MILRLNCRFVAIFSLTQNHVRSHWKSAQCSCKYQILTLDPYKFQQTEQRNKGRAESKLLKNFFNFQWIVKVSSFFWITVQHSSDEYRTFFHICSITFMGSSKWVLRPTTSLHVWKYTESGKIHCTVYWCIFCSSANISVHPSTHHRILSSLMNTTN